MGISLSLNFPIEPFKVINPQSSFVLIGSCFTENIGQMLGASGFEANINPFGILFNPASIAKAFQRIIRGQTYSEAELYKNHENRYVSFDHHGRFSNANESTAIHEINKSLHQAKIDLKNSEIIIITLGSAWVYEYLKTNEIVANCHKVPNSEFIKRLMTWEEVYFELRSIQELLVLNFPTLKIIWTLSPVKHLKDGIVENQQSKATLILALQQLLKGKPVNQYYFPAYEIVTDELRDYRFFEQDHAHPNLLAIRYVWERFLQSCFTDEALERVLESEIINKQLNHKTLHESLSQEPLQQRILDFLDKYPVKQQVSKNQDTTD